MTIRSGIPGKLGIVRLKGDALSQLRMHCFIRDHWECTMCGKIVTWQTGHMAHIIGRGRGGSDEISNVKTLCAEHHAASHNAGGKPCPAKSLNP
ncbi:MAG: HNH endonuclease [Sulfobacillus sp.]